jgi:hypothetical protein
VDVNEDDAELFRLNTYLGTLIIGERIRTYLHFQLA